jgi:YteA family regulatory protein
MITEEQQNRCKAILMERQSKLIKHVQDHFGLQSAVKDTTGELSSYDNHPADMGTELFERGKDIALNEHAEKELEEINSALHAINEGTYGICIECGADIPFERLEIVPTTDRCTNHANDQTFTRDHPVEAEIFSPNINPDEVTEETQVGYDAEDTWQDVSRYGTSETPSDFYGDRDNYNKMYPNSDELIGAAEVVEDFLVADIDGKFSGVAPNHQKYENEFED